MQTDDYVSGYIEDFINFIDSIEEQHSISTAELEEANVNLQDLQHFIEFGQADGRMRQKVYKLYRETRQKRRQAKENLELCAPILEWLANNGKALQGLRGLLGKVRKVESSQANRAYAIRSHILDGITTMSHLSER